MWANPTAPGLWGCYLRRYGRFDQPFEFLNYFQNVSIKVIFYLKLTAYLLAAQQYKA
jgi:hypothetical protein